VYDLAALKAYIGTNGVDVFSLATQKASDDLLTALRWRLNDLAGFFSCLEKRHYRGSQWVYGSEKAKIAYPADVYIMGYNRIKVQEWEKVDPWNYLKFSFSLEKKTIEIFSIHPEN